jgi:ferrous iron transport protein B
VFFRVFEQGKAFTVSAGTMIFAVAIVIWALGYYPHPASIAAKHDAIRQATVASGVAGDELAQRMATIDHDEASEYLNTSLLGRMGRWIEPAVRPLGWDWRIGTAAISSFPAREVVVATMGTIYGLGSDKKVAAQGLREKMKAATWPDGRPVFNAAVAFSLMVFFALCCQCGATLATIKRETRSWRWPIFTFVYMTALAYVGAFITYQVAIRLV